MKATSSVITESHAAPPVTIGAAAPPRFLVLLAAYNGGAWIREQLESILVQTGVDVRIVVRDDGSVDTTRTEVERFADDARVRLSPPSPPTGSAAQNFLALIRENRADEFDFVAFADQDDIWNADKLQRACRALRGEDVTGYSSAVTAAWDDGRERTMRQLAAPRAGDFLLEGAGQGCTFVLPSAFYARVRDFFTEQQLLTRDLHYHDWAIYALARTWTLKWCFDSHPTMRYRQHRANDTGARQSLAGINKRLSLIASGWYRGQSLVITRLCLAANPGHPVVTAWYKLLVTPPSFRRRLKIAWFCLKRGRRKTVDTAVLIVAALAGWI